MKQQAKPLALYIHIPFCVRKCLYCDFISFSSEESQKEQYVQALRKEMSQWKKWLSGKYYIKTVFIGGGTPTCLPAKLLDALGMAIQDFCQSLQQTEKTKMPVEVTIEANPGTIKKEQISILKKYGINRVSVGLQSAQSNELQALGRIHTYEEFLKSFDLLCKNGISNINIDLMADIPQQTLASYQDTLKKVIALHPQHISSYSLIVEEGTPFYQMQQQNRLPIPDEDTDRKMYEITQEMLAESGYHRYEISNYAMEGKECLHNMAYWQMQEYLGLGLGASSYFAGFRFQNTNRMKDYLLMWQKENDAAWADCSKYLKQKTKGCHLLSCREEKEEFVFLGLRMMQGISLSEYQERFQSDFLIQYENVLPKLFEQKLLAQSENRDRIYLTDRGIDLSNAVLAEFLLDE